MKRFLFPITLMALPYLMSAQVTIEQFSNGNSNLFASSVETNIFCEKYCDKSTDVSAFAFIRIDYDKNYSRGDLYVYNEDFEPNIHVESAADFRVIDFNSPTGGMCVYGPCVTQYLFNDDPAYEFIVAWDRLLVVNEHGEEVMDLSALGLNVSNSHNMIYWNGKVYIYARGRGEWWQLTRGGASRVERLSPEKETVMNSVFSLDGKPQEVPSQGFNIIRAGDSTKKVLVR